MTALMLGYMRTRRADAYAESIAMRAPIYTPRRGWSKRSACDGAPEHLWFGRGTRGRVICETCPVRIDCAATAIQAENADHTAHLIEVRSMNLSVTPKGLRLDDANPLGDLLDRLSPTATFAAPAVTTPTDDERPISDKAKELFERVKATKGTPTADTLREFANEAGLPLTARAIDGDQIYAEQINLILESAAA